MPHAGSAGSAIPSRQHQRQDAVPFTGGFWEIAKERPHELLDQLQRLLSEAQMKNERQVVERTYCMMALVHAARGDLPRALERLGQARSSALRHGDTAEVDRISDQVLKLLS
ncbi:MAG: hypothetical protein U1A78_25935 [Polyangia bacterium]